MKIALGVALVRAVMYVMRKERRYSEYAAANSVRDAGPTVAEPLRPEDLNVAQNTPL